MSTSSSSNGSSSSSSSTAVGTPTHHSQAIKRVHTRQWLSALILAVPTFFLLLIELEHIHVARYHAQQEDKFLQRISLNSHQHDQHQLSSSEALRNHGKKGVTTTTTVATAAIGKDKDENIQRLDKIKVSKELSIQKKVKAAVPAVMGDYRLPPLESIIDKDKNIIGDPQPLLQFAIIGFGKCGTSSLMNWFADHPQLQALRNEVWSLVFREPGTLVKRLHQGLKKNLPRGYKCPGDINQHYVIDYYRTLFPKTKLFVGIRHPIHWFQSLYNFRIQNFETYETMPHPNRLIGACTPGFQFTCTIKGNFAYSLLRLGKQHWNGTRETTALEQQIVAPGHGRRKGYDPAELGYLPNPVFLFDLTQLADQNKTRKDAFRHTIQDFLGITEELPDVMQVTPGLQWNETVQAQKDAMKMDICEKQYIPLRLELLYLARQTSEWIRTSFLDLPDVHVANRDHFEEIMETYMHDPCGTESEEVSEDEVKAIHLETKLHHWATEKEKGKIVRELLALETITKQRNKN